MMRAAGGAEAEGRLMKTTFLQRIDAALTDGRAAAELVRRFLAANRRPKHEALPEDPLPSVLRSACARVELSTGYRYLFENEPGLVSHIAAAVEHERQSGRFLRFRIELQPNCGPITVDVSGPGARAFLTALEVPDGETAHDFFQRLADERRKAWLAHAG
jgi:hypothetical protein